MTAMPGAGETGRLRVSGRTFAWVLERASDRYPRLSRFARAVGPIDVLRIHEAGTGYDIAILVHEQAYPDRREPYLWLGTCLVLGDGYPNRDGQVAAGRTLDLPRRHRGVSHRMPGFLEVQRIVQWSLGRRFRASTATGGCHCEQCVARTATIELALAQEPFVAPPLP
jgi:hypothetical protein